MRVMGIDPGSQITGYAVIQDEELLEAGVFRLRGSTPQRLAELMKDLGAVLTRFNPEWCGVETPFVNPKFMNAVVPLSQARGAIVGVLATYGVNVMDISPSGVKKSTGAGGGATKERVAELVSLQLGVKLEADAADAAAIAIATYRRQAQPLGTPASCTPAPPPTPESGRKSRPPRSP